MKTQRAAWAGGRRDLAPTEAWVPGKQGAKGPWQGLSGKHQPKWPAAPARPARTPVAKCRAQSENNLSGCE